MTIKALLKPECCKISSEEFTKKRVLDSVSKLLAHSNPKVDSKSLLQQFIARERLGSTGIGQGIALPHIRLGQIEEAQGACLLLENALDYDSPDEAAVDIIFGLIVPEDATEEHLQILAELASLFNNAEFCKKLRQCKSHMELYQLLTAPDHKD